MGRLGSKDLAFFTLGGTEHAGNLISYDFDAEVILKSCKAFNARHDSQAEVKRRLDFSAETKRRSAGGVCQVCKLISALTLGTGFDYKSRFTGATFNVTTNSQRADAGGDVFQDHQALTTTFSGSFTVMINSDETNTILALFVGAEAGLRKTMTFTDGAGSLQVPVFINTGKKTGSDGGLTEITFGFMGDGTPVSSGGTGTLFALALTGSADLTYVHDDGVDNIEGDALISSGDITIARDEIQKEKYSFLGLGDPAIT